MSNPFSIREVAEKLRAAGMDETAVVRQLVKDEGRSKVQVKRALQDKEKWKSSLVRQGYSEKGNQLQSEIQLPKFLRKQVRQNFCNSVMRAAGAGRRSYVSFLYPGVKQWLENMRGLGHWVDKADLVDEFEALAKEWLRRVAAKSALEDLPAAEKLRQKKVEERLHGLSKQKARERLANVLQRACRARFLKPQRVIPLSKEEERTRAENTWKCYDVALHEAAFGDEESLKRLFAAPEQAKAHRSETALLFSDEIPFWIAIAGGNKQLYAETEMMPKKKKKLASEAPGQAEATSQMRTKAHSEASRHRVTFEALQIVRNYFSESEEPVGEIGTSALVLIGAHARLSNISDDETWIADEQFVSHGREVVRKAGTWTRGILRSWVKLRRESAEVREMLTRVMVLQQPAGFVDGVIMKWLIEDLAERFPLMVHQRDMFEAGLNENAQKASFLAHSVMSYVAGKMTAVLQLTDTDVSFSLKAAATREKASLRKMMRAAAVSKNEPAPSHRVGQYELLRIAAAAHDHMVELNLEKNVVLAGLRRNGMLAWRPSLSQGKLVRSDEQEWTKSLPQGNHRMPAEWMKQRHEWMVDGIPQKPEWKGCGAGVKGIEDMTDIVPETGSDVKLVLKSWAADPELKKDKELLEGLPEHGVILEFDEQFAADLSLDETVLEMRQAIDEARKSFVENKWMKKQIVSSGARQRRKERRVMTRRYARGLLKIWKAEQAELLSKYSRRQLLAAFIATAGAKKKKKNKNKSKDGKKASEVNE